MASSPELMTLVKCHEQLIVVIRNNLEAIARFLFIEEIISHETYREVTDSKSYHTDHERAKIILRCLEDKAQEDVRYYSIFYEYLNKENHFKLISQMNEAIVQFRKKSKLYVILNYYLSISLLLTIRPIMCSAQ